MDAYRLFQLATRFVRSTPEPLGRALFHGIGTVSGVLPIPGVKQLRRNYNRISQLPPLAGVTRSVRGMQHYMRYYYEIFRQADVTIDQLPYRNWLTNGDFLRGQLNSGRPVIAALMHTGNWDLAGAWSEKYLVHVVTVAEKLADPRMADSFLEFREELGMTIYQAVSGNSVFKSLQHEAQEAVLLPLLADRDLTASGVVVRLCGHEMMVAPGPALLAISTGEPIVPLMMAHRRLHGDHARQAGTRWGNEIIAFDPIYPAVDAGADTETRRRDVERLCQEWMNQIEPWLVEHVEHWHMLQKVFVADLDQERLRRARETA